MSDLILPRGRKVLAVTTPMYPTSSSSFPGVWQSWGEAGKEQCQCELLALCAPLAHKVGNPDISHFWARVRGSSHCTTLAKMLCYTGS
jgi:hypothetical protein